MPIPQRKREVMRDWLHNIFSRVTLMGLSLSSHDFNHLSYFIILKENNTYIEDLLV